MNVLLVAHPDDCCLWFAPEKYDKIIIVFGDFGDARGKTSGDKRRAALAEHPLKDKIIHLDYPESHYTWDRGNIIRKDKFNRTYDKLVKYLKTLDATSITTHAATGEYDNLDHIMCFMAAMEADIAPVNGADPKLFKQIRDVYKKHDCWTWYF